MAVCPSCGHENPAGARFCNGCGTALEGESTGLAQERRVVTVLFADMAGFTARAERLDPEDVRAILSRYYARLRGELESFGGTVEKFIGDAVVAVFGAPTAHGDDPERAVRAAFALCDAVTEMNLADPDLKLEIRVAVNTGEAIVSTAELNEGMVAGDVINTASRMQSSAPINAILVGEETYRATRGGVDYRASDSLRVKGKQSPVPVWRAVAIKGRPGERAASVGPMLGRLSEIATLRRTFDGVVSDRRPNLVTIFGDAGIGKTRLAAEFADALGPEEALLLRGRSLPYGASTPYGPFAQQVKQFAGIFASDHVASAQQKLTAELAEIATPQVVTEIAPHLELLVGLSNMGEVADRQILFRAARRFVEALASSRPVVLIFEDLQWADNGTLDLLESVASRVRDVPVMMLALARPELLLLRPAWGGGLPAYSAISLEPLDPDDARELATQLLHDGHAVDLQGSRIVETAEGNPLFIEELAAAAVDRHFPAGSGLPTTIRGLVSARLDALPAAERALLLDAAIIGKVFWRRALALIRGNGDALAEVLDSLEARDLIRHEGRSWIEGDEQFAFKHALIRDVAYATVPRARRRRLHAVVARFLEQATAGAGATATALAHHWREAGDDERALEYLLLAGDQAGRGWAKDEAARLYGEALELCAKEPELRRQIVRKQALAFAALQHVADVRHSRRAGAPGDDLN
jgi:class 3 adenylate cyclase